jgi:uncharacterized protein
MQVNRIAIFDVVLVLVVLLGVAYFLSFAGVPVPGQIAVLLCLVAIHVRLHASGFTWADLGLRKPKSWWRLPLWVIAAYLTVALANLFVIIPFSGLMGWSAPAFDKLKLIPGDVTSLLFYLSVAWTTAAIGEELLFRGFLLHRIEAAFVGNRAALALAILLQALAFGLAHLYQGPRGVFTAAMVGLVFGLIFVATKRDLVAVIIAHGLIDTISLIALWSGAKVT